MHAQSQWSLAGQLIANLMVVHISPLTLSVMSSACNNMTCENGGVCRVDSGFARCDCLDGYTGVYCQVNVSVYMRNPIEICMNSLSQHCLFSASFTHIICIVSVRLVFVLGLSYKIVL